MTLYFPLALIAGYTVASYISEKTARVCSWCLLMGSFIYCFVPLSSERDKDLYAAIPIIDQKCAHTNDRPRLNIVLNDSYAFYSVLPLMQFYDDSDTREIKSKKADELERIFDELKINRGNKNFLIIAKNEDLGLLPIGRENLYRFQREEKTIVCLKGSDHF